MRLYNHQKEILERNPSRHLLCWDTGTGKTYGSLALCYKNTRSILIVCPKALKEKWKRDSLKFVAEYFGALAPVQGQMTVELPKIISKEEFRRDWETLGYFDALVIDEAHYFSGINSAMSKNMVKYIKKNRPKFIWALTATPYMSTPWNIYTLARILGYNWNYLSFKEKFFTQKYIMGRYIPQVKSNIEPEIAKLVKVIGSTVRLDECADVPEQVIYPEYFKITQKQQSKIKEIKEFEINPVVRYTKYHQVENGALKSDGYTADEFFDTDKNERIIELCTEHKKVAIFARYNLQLEMLKRIVESTGKKIFIINGAVKEKDAVVQEAEAADECVVLINAACSEGYELPSIGLIIFASLSFSYKDYKQALGRFLRINRLKKNVYVHLVTAGSIDESVYESIMKKQDFDMQIYAQTHA